VVLVVDDEESMRYFLRKALRREGYEVVEAEDGPAAIEAAHARTPDVALVDIRMPGMDGVALMRALRATHPHLPVVLMTAYGSVENALQAMKQGATDYVTKPFRVDEIRTSVAKALDGAAAAERPHTVRDMVDADASPPAPVTPPPARPAPQQAAAVETPAREIVPWLRERVAALALPVADDVASGDAGLRGVVRLAELVYADELLRLTSGNISRAAEIAGITRPNMHRKVTDLGLSADDYRPGAGHRRPESAVSNPREEQS
jgi:DNA-binding NtrC family response regulator